MRNCASFVLTIRYCRFIVKLQFRQRLYERGETMVYRIRFYFFLLSISATISFCALSSRLENNFRNCSVGPSGTAGRADRTRCSRDTVQAAARLPQMEFALFLHWSESYCLHRFHGKPPLALHPSQHTIFQYFAQKALCPLETTPYYRIWLLFTKIFN